jgi:LysM repeat protein
MTTIKRIEQKHNQKRRNRFLIWIMALSIVILSLSAQADPKTEQDLIQYATLTVTAGDTIWGLAEDVNQMYYQNEMNMRDLVTHIQDTNDLNSVVIIEGQTLKVATNLNGN